MARYEIRTAGWEFMPWTSDAYVAQLEIHRDGACWDRVPVRVSGVAAVRAGVDDEQPSEDDEFWSGLLRVAAAEVRARIDGSGKPSEIAGSAAVYPDVLETLEAVRRIGGQRAGECLATFDGAS